MRRFPHLFAVAAIAVWCMAGSGAQAADESNVSAAPTGTNPGAEAVRNLALAQQLAQYARTRKDPLLMIAAAKLTKEASAHDSKRDKEAEATPGDEGDKAPPQAAPAAPRSASAVGGLPKTDQDAVTKLLDEARGLAGDRKELLAMIEELSHVTRGAVGGPKRSVDAVNPRSTDTYKIRFRAGEVATVGVMTDGNPHLYLQVYDENNHRICTDRYDGSESLMCRWVPVWQGVFYIKVRNRGYDQGDYVLVTN